MQKRKFVVWILFVKNEWQTETRKLRIYEVIAINREMALWWAIDSAKQHHFKDYSISQYDILDQWFENKEPSTS